MTGKKKEPAEKKTEAKMTAKTEEKGTPGQVLTLKEPVKTEEPSKAEEGRVLCGANASNMLFYLNEEAYGILPEEIKKELKILCVSYCADVGGAITLSFSEAHALLITALEPIDEIGSALKIKQIQKQYEALFEQLEAFSRQYEALLQTKKSAIKKPAGQEAGKNKQGRSEQKQ